MKSIKTLTYEVEKLIQDEIQYGFKNHYNENTTTQVLLAKIRDKLRGEEISGLSQVMKIDCDAFKLEKPLETKYGDIAIIIKIHYADKDVLEGVGFLEAKIRYKNGRFGAAKMEQIIRIYGNAPNSFTLLYDDKPISLKYPNVDIPFRPTYISDKKDAFFKLYKSAHGFDFPLDDKRNSNTKAVVIPNNIVVKRGKINTSMYKHSIPFSYQLCCRYLLGFDLNFGRTEYESAVKYAESLNPSNLLTIYVSYGPDSNNTLQTQINTDLYQRITPDNIGR